MKLLCLFLFFLSGISACQSSPAPDTVKVAPASNTDTLPAFVKPGYSFPYQLDEPDETLKLSPKLTEISGLSPTDKKNELCAVQDEKGTLFILDRKDGGIEEEIKFWKTGDYEGVEVVGDDAYVVKSNGTIYEIKRYGKKEQEVFKYNSFLNRDNDVEGLCYDSKKNRLLLACKGRPATGESLTDFKYKKCIYSFDLGRKQLDSLPAYELSLEAIQAYLKTSPVLKKLEKLLEFFTADQDNLSFNPSAIAIQPFTGNLYLTSSVGKVLLVLNQEGNILYLEKLDKKIHKQPEGLSFDHKGNLYISNEGKEGGAKIRRFNYPAEKVEKEE